MAEKSHESKAPGSNTSSGERKLHQTPTWAVAGVCAIIILISFILVNALQRIGKWLTRKHKTALYEALDKVKEELMVMGFISLFLTFSQGYISKICIPEKSARHMLPCELEGRDSGEQGRRRLLANTHRMLASEGAEHKCHQGFVPLITVEAAHQLHILIFFLAVVHVLYSAALMMLGRLKTRGWKEWESETASLEYEIRNDPARIRLPHQTSFVRVHNSFWARTSFIFYVGCFFRQFFRSVTKADYLTLRNGFITTHMPPGSQFNFQKHIKRSNEHDFKVVVGVSPVLWASFVIFLLLNVNGWHTIFWASILPLIVILAVGTKLQAILTRMAMEITERHTVVLGIPLVQGSDEYFWFSRPHYLLSLLHFALFQNAFQLTYFLWILYEFGLKSCFHDKRIYVILKIIVGIVAMVICSYSTLPLYALVTQMGSQMKKCVFDEQRSKAFSKRHTDVKQKEQEPDKPASARTLGGMLNNSMNSVRRHSSSGRVLNRFMSTGHSTHLPPYVKLNVLEGKGDGDGTVEVIENRRDSEISVLPTVLEIKPEDDIKPSPS